MGPPVDATLSPLRSPDRVSMFASVGMGGPMGDPQTSPLGGPAPAVDRFVTGTGGRSGSAGDGGVPEATALVRGMGDGGMMGGGGMADRGMMGGGDDGTDDPLVVDASPVYGEGGDRG